MKVFAMQI